MKLYFYFLAILWAPILSFGLTVSQQSIDEQKANADLVATVEVIEISTLSDLTVGTSWTAKTRVLTVLQMQDSLSCPVHPGDDILLQGIGGELGNRGVLYPGYPKPHRLKRYVAYLNERQNCTFTIAGFDFGLVPVEGSRAFSRNRVDGSDGSGDGAFLHWKSNYFPVPYFVSSPTFENLPGFIDAINLGFATWRNVEGSTVDFLGLGCVNSKLNENDGINSIIFITKDWPFDASVIAITRNFFIASGTSDSGAILDSDILINSVDHAFTTTGESGKHDVQNIVTHEVGHVLGLGHEVAPVDIDATMFAAASTGETKKRTLHSNDISGLKQGYSGVANKIGGVVLKCDVKAGVPTCAASHYLTGESRYALLWSVLYSLIPVLTVTMTRLKKVQRDPSLRSG